MTAAPQRVADFMTTGVVSVAPDTEIMRAVHLMVSNDVSGIPVVDGRGELLGILTERDCIKVAVQAGYHDELGGRVSQYMTRDVLTVSPEDSLMDLAEIFATRPFRRCPVLEAGRLVGMISRRDILRAMTRSSWFGG